MPFERPRPEPPTMMGRALREKRRKDNLSLREVEAASGVALNTLDRIERGVGVPSLANAFGVIRWLGTRPATAYEMLSELGDAS